MSEADGEVSVVLDPFRETCIDVMTGMSFAAPQAHGRPHTSGGKSGSLCLFTKSIHAEAVSSGFAEAGDELLHLYPFPDVAVEGAAHH